MKYLTTMLLVIYCLVPSKAQENTLNMMPVPEHYLMGKSKFRLRSDFRVSLDCPSDSRVNAAIYRMLNRLDGRIGLFFDQDYLGKKDESFPMQIRTAQKAMLSDLFADESYKLEISASRITLNANTDVGVIRGLETFLQLLDADDEGYFFPEITITDSPRFRWRGLLIDVGRHFMPIEVIKRNIDGMAAVKMNVLHLHLTEDQGFRIECKTFPKLHELGSDGKFFTQSQIREIIKYADDRGIRVVPEFDMPGHSTSWFVGYPELASAPGPYSLKRSFGVHDPTMDPTREETYRFLEKFFAEMAAIFPDPYIHIGGDENNGKQWNENSKIQQFKQEKGYESNHELQSYFNRRIHQILKSNNKRMMGWDEIFNTNLSKDIVIQSWRGREALYSAAQSGYQSVLSNGFYIDLVNPASQHYQVEPLPNDSPLTAVEESLVLGGEATMWSELVTPETIDSRIWPRTAAIAERFWSPAFVYDLDDMYRRLEVTSLGLEELGLQHNSYYEMMLRRLANGFSTEPLKTLVDVIEPLKNYARHGQRVKLTTFSPFTRLADAARPDAKIARDFRKLVDTYLENNDTELLSVIQNWLFKWKDNHQGFEKLAKESPQLKRALSLSKDLQNVSIIGIQAISEIKLHSKQWKQDSKTVLEYAKKPREECELMIISAIEKLVEHAQ